jgi:hypothetical protein
VRATSVHADVWHAVNGIPYVLRLMGSGLGAPRRHVPGTDLAGEVVSAGGTRFAPGDRVFGEITRNNQWSNAGAFAEFAAVDEARLAHMPPGLPFEQAAAVPTAALIALTNLRDQGRVSAGQRVLVNGAAGAVGVWAVQLAKTFGAQVTAVDAPAKLDLLKDLGADHVIDYTQQDFVNRRTLHSDILFMQDDRFGWVEFRDVATSNGAPVRDRQERLLALFSKPKSDRLAQAQRIVAEGSRFNLDPAGVHLNRTINLPLTAVRFLRTSDQYRSSFHLGRSDRAGVVSLEFTEEHQPRLISMPDHAAAIGRFETEAASGRVQSSTLTLRTRLVTATIKVQFAPDANVGMWLPATMEEQYVGSFNGTVTGAARYSKYRQFKVDTSEIMKH